MKHFLNTQNLWLSTLMCLATAVGADQRGYHAFRPVPDEALRELAADRPDATESPQTVDAGRFQLESDIASYLNDKRGESFAIFTTNFKWGLRHNVDLQLVFTPFARERTSGRGSDNGIRNLEIRTKINLWGNDGEEETALALLPFVLVPTGGSSLDEDDVTGGIIIPFGTTLGRGWGLGAQVGVEWVRNDADDGYVVEFSQTIVVGRDIVGPWAGFLEISSVVPERGSWIGTWNVGVTYAAHANLQIDIGVNIGIVSEADDFAVFLGVTRRF